MKPLHVVLLLARLSDVITIVLALMIRQRRWISDQKSIFLCGKRGIVQSPPDRFGLTRKKSDMPYQPFF